MHTYVRAAIDVVLCHSPVPHCVALHNCTNEQQEFLRRALIGQFKPQLRNHGISARVARPFPSTIKLSITKQERGKGLAGQTTREHAETEYYDKH